MANEIIPALAIAVLLGTPVFIALFLQNGNRTPRELRNLRRQGVERSNMQDQTDPQYDLPAGASSKAPIRIKAIFIHPIKSCAPVELNRTQLLKSGFFLDRFFALATEVNRPASEGGPIWRFISQRTKPLMSQIKTEVWLPCESSDENDPLVKSQGCVVFRFPDPDHIGWSDRLISLIWRGQKEVVGIAPISSYERFEEKHGLTMKPFTIHSREAKGLDLGGLSSVADTLPKLKRFLKISDQQGLTLLRLTPDSLVRTEKNLAPLQHIGTPAIHGYTDQQPVNINNLASVHAVSALLPKENQPLNALRFRANIWVTGAPAFDEDTWKRYRIVPNAGPSPTLSVVCRTSRCTLPNVNPHTGKPDTDTPGSGKTRGKPQPSSTLIEHRTIEDGNPKALGYIGMHCVPEDSCFGEMPGKQEGVYVQVGDEVEVLERGAHLYGSTGNDY
ncbi:uncharacterized protein FIESC28_02894 [Fusarium coffeatum]|uniref:MOSC domain-containing protein n=1 Tax=Fusarium coffeatum TaxID=231269 RepID=A0A366S512_9HYPO|nr:uncharacterized protein FIESC28_02894 [Fusarium coffeatum]RBR24404.1 hypothetical protein FIESC28_02894 [Fusarium coffeatum]